MDRSFIKTKASEFRSNLAGGHVSITTMRDSMRSLGWDTIIYNDSGINDALLRDFHLDDIAKTKSAFCFDSRAKRFIAVDGRKIREELYAHEVGHIILRHNLSATTPSEEREADMFARYLLRRSMPLSKILFIGFICLATIFVAGRLAVSFMLDTQVSIPAPVATESVTQESETEMVVITPSGDKYHRPDCMYVTNNDGLIKVTVDEAVNAGKEPCKVCRP